MRHTSVIVFAVLLAQTIAAPPALAGNCYDVVGCISSQYFPKAPLKEWSCQLLWEVRNGVYKDRGYCFKTKTGINMFGNAGCYIHDQGAVPLNSYESANVGAIRSVELAKGCHYGG